ncbi:MAG: hypothetical protein ACTSRW_09280 [Candidatus Helarchaeota archaeon]
MNDEDTRMMIRTACETFLRYWDEINRDHVKHFDNLKRIEENNRKKSINRQLNKIKQIEDDINSVKSKMKESKDSSLKKKMESLKQELKDESAKLKEFKKDVSRLTKKYDGLRSDYESCLKNLQKYLQEFQKLDIKRTKPTRLTEMILIFIPKITEEFKLMNELASVEEFMALYDFKFNLKHIKGTVTVKSEQIFRALLLESMAFNLLYNSIYHENITSKKEELVSRALSAIKRCLELVKEDDNKDLIKHYENVLIFFEMEYLKILAIQEFEGHEYLTATSYFLEALTYLRKIKSVKYFKEYLEEQEICLQALASDAYNLIYLLHSYKNWSYLETKTENPILKELADITKNRIEDFITPMYGFPEDEQLEKITSPKIMLWPKPERSPKLDGIAPL